MNKEHHASTAAGIPAVVAVLESPAVLFKADGAATVAAAVVVVVAVEEVVVVEEVETVVLVGGEGGARHRAAT